MIEAIYCLSKPERSDRREKLIPQLERAMREGQLPRLPITWWSKPLREEVFIPPSSPLLPGWYAATEAHKLMLEDAWRCKFYEFLILEDDAFLTPAFYAGFTDFDRLVKKTRPDWLAVWLGYRMQRNPIPLSDGILINKGCIQCHAYIANRHGAYRMLDHLFNNNRKVADVAFRGLMEACDSIYSPAEQMIITARTDSDSWPGWPAQQA